jgi:hypothetical protein
MRGVGGGLSKGFNMAFPRYLGEDVVLGDRCQGIGGHSVLFVLHIYCDVRLDGWTANWHGARVEVRHENTFCDDRLFAVPRLA